MPDQRKPRILLFSTLFPNAAQPIHGVFVENRLRHLYATGEIDATVLAPVPWFPFKHRAFGAYAAAARAPHMEERGGITIHHPRYLTIPKIGMSIAPLLLYLAARPALGKLIRDGHAFDLIDAHYFYPDGVAAAMLGREFDLPVTITGRGTDLNLIPKYTLPRRQIQWAAGRAAAMITVCQALKESLIELGVPPHRVTVLRNGVDLDGFRPPADRDAARAAHGITRRTVISVGHLIERKGHDLVIRAVASLPGTDLLIAGDGPEERNLRGLIESLGVGDRVRLLGRLPHSALAGLYGAADALVLASNREGWANVLLEAMACGTPAVATDVWGTRECVAAPAAGVLVAERSAEALKDGLVRLFADPPRRDDTRAYAERFSWEDTSTGQLTLFHRILAKAA